MRRAAAAARSLALLLLASAVAGAASPPAAAQDGLETYAEGFEFLTNLAISPDGRFFVTEKETGEVWILEDGERRDEPFATFSVFGGAERGLLGIALHPGFPGEPWVYLYLSDGGDERNRVIRVRADGDRSGTVQNVIDLLPAGSGYHNGGDIAFGPDGNLYVVTGEAHNPELAQAPEDLGGKILRLDPGGGIPDGNPFGPSSPTYSLGHRNSFGLCVDPDSGQVWETENGPSSHDEVNRIEPGANYGWPEVSGPGGGDRFVDPVVDYPSIVVPTGCAVAAGSLWWTTFSGTLHQAEIQGDGLGSERVTDVGRELTDVQLGPDGFLYVVATDRILRMRVGDASPATSAPPPADPPAEEDTPPASPDPAADERGSNTVSFVVIAVLLALGIVVMRSRIRPPDEPFDPTAGP